MSRDAYVLQRLARRGIEITILIEESEIWQRRVKSDPALPATYAELCNLTGSLFGPAKEKTDAAAEDQESAAFEERCGESLYTRIYGGLENPYLSAEERDAVDLVLAEAVPAIWQTRETEHFVLRWTDSDPDPLHNIADPALNDEAAVLFELAWHSLEAAFGVAPFVPPGMNRIEVDFLDLPNDSEGQTTPRGPIQLDAPKWQADSALRAPLAAHELFHRLQYAFDFRVTWAQTATGIDWFSEGTARWAEVFVHQQLTNAAWLTDWMAFPHLDFLGLGSYVLPFWIFSDARHRPIFAMLDLLQSCKAQQDARQGLEAALGPNAFGDFFALFAAEAWKGELKRKPDGQILYPQILGPNGQPIESRPAATAALLDAGGNFPAHEVEVGAFASCYHTFTFAPGADGRPLLLAARAGEDLTCQVLSLKAGRIVAASSVISRDFVHQQTIQLAAADSLVLIASGRGAPAQVEISAQVG
jgi:hypothetical protein